jgi:hypothetical protein
MEQLVLPSGASRFLKGREHVGGSGISDRQNLVRGFDAQASAAGDLRRLV